MATRATIGATSTAVVVLSSTTSKTGATTACLAIEDGFIDSNDSLSVVVDDFKNGLGWGYHFDGDDGLTTKNKICGEEFQSRMRKRKMGERRKMWKGWYINKRNFFL